MRARGWVFAVEVGWTTVGFGDRPDPGTVEGHRNAMDKAAETRRYNRRMKELEAEDAYLLSVASDICGKEAVEATLKNAAETDTNIKAYLNAVEENRTLRATNQRPDPTSLTYGDVRSLIEANKAGGILHLWAKTASESDLRLAG